MDEVNQLVRDHVVNLTHRRLNYPPVQADAPLGVGRSPPLPLLAD
jgi:hypothetical protein